MQAVDDILKNFDFFKSMNFEVHSIQPSKKLEKTFMVENLDTSEKYKVRLNTDAFPESVRKELNVLKFFSTQPKHYWMPDLIHISANEALLVTNFIDGISLDKLRPLDAVFSEEVAQKIKALLADFHQITHNEVLSLSKNIKYDNWYNYLKSMFQYDFDRLSGSNLISSDDEDFVWHLLHNYQNYFLNITPSLIHGDLKPHNLVWREKDRSIHLIDFESCRIGDVNFDNYRIHYDIGRTKEMEQDDIFWLYRLNTCIHWLANHYSTYNEVVTKAFDETNRLIKKFRTKHT